ncbi:MAG: PDZ domain-containing protein, partial [Candidatus Latescibacteria bacterium]|nr:PDZ domain-containing protein [Candidatus Latescibacterota bacterium]
MAEDKQGRMWFGVADGVRVYDGLSWTPYTEADGASGREVRALCVAGDGSVYTGGTDGIYRFREEQWTRVFPPQGNAPWMIWDLEQLSDGSLWAATPWGALRLQGKTRTLYSTADVAESLKSLAPYVTVVTVPDGIAPTREWPDGLGMSVVKMAGPRNPGAVIVKVAPGGPADSAGLRVGDRITGLDAQTQLYLFGIASREGTSVDLSVTREGVAEPFDVAVIHQELESTFLDFHIYDVYGDRQGDVWLGILGYPEGGEILRCSLADSGRPDAETWRLYAEEDGLSPGTMPRIHQTRDGAVWAVSEHGYRGVNRFDGTSWKSSRLSELVGGSDTNRSLLEARDGTVWIGQHGALAAFRQDVWTSYTRPDAPLPTGRILGLLESSDGALWTIGRNQEAAAFDYLSGRWTTYENLLYFCDTMDGSRWFISEDDGVVRHKMHGGHGGDSAGTWTRYGTEDGLMDTPSALAITRTGALWALGTHRGQAATARLEGSRWTMDLHPRFTHGISPRAVFESSDGSVWVGSMWPNPERGHLGGVLRFDPSAASAEAWTHYTPPEAPFATYAIGQTADGTLWFG